MVLVIYSIVNILLYFWWLVEIRLSRVFWLQNFGRWRGPARVLCHSMNAGGGTLRCDWDTQTLPAVIKYI